MDGMRDELEAMKYKKDATALANSIAPPRSIEEAAANEMLESAKHRSAEYEKFMRELTLFTVSGKNLHDDAPDACAMLVDFITGGIKVVTVAKRPF